MFRIDKIMSKMLIWKWFKKIINISFREAKGCLIFGIMLMAHESFLVFMNSQTKAKISCFINTARPYNRFNFLQTRWDFQPSSLHSGETSWENSSAKCSLNFLLKFVTPLVTIPFIYKKLIVLRFRFHKVSAWKNFVLRSLRQKLRF